MLFLSDKSRGGPRKIFLGWHGNLTGWQNQNFKKKKTKINNTYADSNAVSIHVSHKYSLNYFL